MNRDVQLPDNCGVLEGWRYQTAAEMQRMTRCGEAIELAREINERTGMLRIAYKRLKPARSNRARVIRVVSIGIGALIALWAVLLIAVWALWSVLSALPAVVWMGVCIAGAWWLWSRISHSGTCLGLHRGGCKV